MKKKISDENDIWENENRNENWEIRKREIVAEAILASNGET